MSASDASKQGVEADPEPQGHRRRGRAAPPEGRPVERHHARRRRCRGKTVPATVDTGTDLVTEANATQLPAEGGRRIEVISEHPRYRGEVIDAHCHYDDSTRRPGGAGQPGRRADGGDPPVGLPLPARPARGRGAAVATPRAGAAALPRPRLLRRRGAGLRSGALERDLRVAADHGAVGIKVWKNLGAVAARRRPGAGSPSAIGAWSACGRRRASWACRSPSTPAIRRPSSRR